MRKTADLLLTPEQREEKVKAKEAQALKIKEEAQLFDRVFSTGDGKRVLKQIMDNCCYQKPQPLFTASGIDMEGTLMNAILHKHYLWLRQHISPEILRDVENPTE